MKMAWLDILHCKEEKCDSSPFLGRRLLYFLLDSCLMTIPRGLKRSERMKGLEDFVKSCTDASGGYTTMFVVERTDNVFRDHKEVGGCRFFC